MTDEDGSDCDLSGSGGSETGPTEVQLSIDAILELLADWRRRDLLERLVGAPTATATIDELIEHLAEREAEARNERLERWLERVRDDVED